MNWKVIAIFDHAHPKIIESAFSFPEFVPACKKSIYSICSFLRHSQFYSCMTRLPPSFDHSHPKIFWSTFSLCEFVSTCTKSGYFIDLLWRYGWLKNPAVWLAENILANTSGTKVFPNMAFVQEHSK